MHNERGEEVLRFWGRIALIAALAIVVAAILLIVSPGKRYELWVAAIVIGLGLGALMGLTLKVNRDYGLGLIRVPRTWDGAAAAALLLLLTLARLVTWSLTLTDQQTSRTVVGGASPRAPGEPQ